MMDNTPNSSYSGSTAVSYDEGLRSYFRRIYNVMTVGLLLTGAVSFVCAQIPAVLALFQQPIMAIIIAFMPLALVMFMFRGSALQSKSAAQLNTSFYIFSAVFGFCLTPLVVIYTGADIARAFFITAATFAATSAWSYTTKTDLSKLGSFLMMGVIGLIIAIVVNIFLKSSMMDFIISCAGVLIYTGLVAYDTQNLKETYAQSNGDEANGKMAVMGALSLYINFVMLFQFILSLLNSRE